MNPKGGAGHPFPAPGDETPAYRTIHPLIGSENGQRRAYAAGVEPGILSVGWIKRGKDGLSVVYPRGEMGSTLVNASASLFKGAYWHSNCRCVFSTPPSFPYRPECWVYSPGRFVGIFDHFIFGQFSAVHDPPLTRQ